jgi:hypothetical protein
MSIFTLRTRLVMLLAFMAFAVVNTQAQTNAANATPVVTAKPASSVAATTESSAAITVKSFPNPFVDRITFTITSPVSGKGVLELYDLTGRRLDVVHAGEFQAGVTKNVEYKVNIAPRSPIMYKFGVGLKTVTAVVIRFN